MAAASLSNASPLWDPNQAKALLAGAIAGGVSRSATAPLERVKVMQQVQYTNLSWKMNTDIIDGNPKSQRSGKPPDHERIMIRHTTILRRCLPRRRATMRASVQR